MYTVDETVHCCACENTMILRGVSINWTLEAGNCRVSPACEDSSDPTDSLPAIYNRGSGKQRCTIDLNIPTGQQALILSNAKSCEIYSTDEQRKHEYQGSCRGTIDADGGWQLTIAARVSLAACAASSILAWL